MQFLKPAFLSFFILVPFQVLPETWAEGLFKKPLVGMYTAIKNEVSPYFKGCTKGDYILLAAAGTSLIAATMLWQKEVRSLQSRQAEYDSLQAIKSSVDGLVERYSELINLTGDDLKNQVSMYDRIKKSLCKAEEAKRLAADIGILKQHRDHLNQKISNNRTSYENSSNACSIIIKIDALLSTLETVQLLIGPLRLLANAESLVDELLKRYHHEFTILNTFPPSESNALEERIQRLCEYIALKSANRTDKCAYRYELSDDRASIALYKELLECRINRWKKDKQKEALVGQAQRLLILLTEIEVSFAQLLPHLRFLDIQTFLHALLPVEQNLYKLYLHAATTKSPDCKHLLQTIVKARFPYDAHPYTHYLHWLRHEGSNLARYVQALGTFQPLPFQAKIINEAHETLNTMHSIEKNIIETPAYMCEVPAPL